MQAASVRASSASDEEKILALTRAWSAALEARDVDGLLAAHAPDVLLFDVKPPFRILGLEAYRKVWEDCLPCFPARFRSEHRDLEIIVGGDVALARGLHRVVPLGETHPAGESWIRVTIGYQRINGAWQVIHEHVSIPFDPATGIVAPITDPDHDG